MPPAFVTGRIGVSVERNPLVRTRLPFLTLHRPRTPCPPPPVCLLVLVLSAATTMHHTRGAQATDTHLSQAGGWGSTVRVQAGGAPGEGLLAGWQTAAFSLGPRVAGTARALWLLFSQGH